MKMPAPVTTNAVKSPNHIQLAAVPGNEKCTCYPR